MFSNTLRNSIRPFYCQFQEVKGVFPGFPLPGLVLILVLLLFPATPVAAGTSDGSTTSVEYDFPIPPGLEGRVDFWKKVYTEYTTDHAVIHDMDDLGIIYEAVYLGDSKLSRRAKERRTESIKNHYRSILRRLARIKEFSDLTEDEKRVYRMVKGDYYRASRNIRVQIGQKDRFREGLERSGMYMDRIRKILREYGVPVDLAVLPHVESSFQIGAYSSAGAAGIWQFTRGTGNLFLRIGYDVDERRDPYLATEAAAKLLKLNYDNLQSWPLAITAYNHGQQGMKRAKALHGDDIVKIIDNYRSRTFGFASKNFYAEFLAALHVDQNRDRYFPNLEVSNPLKLVSHRFDDYVHVETVMDHFKISREEVARYNPALRQPVISGEKRIPRGYAFQAPADRYSDLQPIYASIPETDRFGGQIRSKWHTVGRGDTLSGIAVRYRTTVNDLKRINNLGPSNRIYANQVLQLPGGVSEKPAFIRAKAEPRSYFKTGETIDYRVQARDNLTKIARKFSSDPGELARINSISNPDALHPGQWLKIPQREVVAQAIKEVITQPETETNPKNFYLKVDKPDSEEKEKGPNVKVDYAQEPSQMDRLNQRRPAFLPVAFASDEHRSLGIGEITVDFDETISHYAEWSNQSVSQLKRVNELRGNAPITVNDQIKVPFTRVTPEKFEERRQEYHKAIQEDFFSNYKISKLVVRSVKKGETLWEICNESTFIPFWLLSSYNADKNINSLHVGEPIVIPLILPSKSEDS